MKLKNIFKSSALLLALGLTTGLSTSCTETDSELVSFVEDNSLSTPNDTVYSLIGIVNKMQAIADRTVLLGELRGELTSLTSDANLNLQDIANFTADASNPYNDARDYYAIIQNCNYFLAKADTTLTKRGAKVFEKEYAVISTYRAWTYLQLALNYGSVPFFTEPLLTEKEADPSRFPHYDVKQIADYFITDLAPYVDTEYPKYGSMGGFNSEKFYIPVRVLLGDLCLWAGRYEEAAKYYHAYLTKQGDYHVLPTASVEWRDFEFQGISDSYASQFSGNSNVLTFIPMHDEEYDGIISYLNDVFNSTADNNYFYQATHSAAHDELSKSQLYTLVNIDPVSQLPDTIHPGDEIVYDNETMRGDLRLQSIYSLRNAPSSSSAYSSLRQTVYKYRSTDYVPLYRIQHVYLRFAEALNRAGYPESAFAVLKYGLCKYNIDLYISEAEREAAGDLLSFSEYYFTRENTAGLHSRGSGRADANTEYAIPELASKSDSILFVENAICDEMGLETATEGLRFYDLMRLSMHRNDPTFLANKVASRNGSVNFDSKLYAILSDSKNWYLPLE